MANGTGVKQVIVDKQPYRTIHHRDDTKDSFTLVLACGHTVRRCSAEVPKKYAFCAECEPQ